MLQRSNPTRHDYQIGDMLNFTKTFPYTGWVYIVKMEKLPSGNNLIYVKALAEPYRESIIDPAMTNRKILNGEVEYVPIKKI